MTFTDNNTDAVAARLKDSIVRNPDIDKAAEICVRSLRQNKEGARGPLSNVSLKTAQAVWSSTLAPGAFLATEAMPLSRDLALS